MKSVQKTIKPTIGAFIVDVASHSESCCWLCWWVGDSMKTRIVSAAVAVTLFTPAVALTQALTSLASLRVGYTTRKNTVKPQGELKAQIDALDAQIADAQRLGRSAELRRLFAKGNTMLAGRPWTDEIDFATSLVIRTAGVVADSTKPYVFRLEQIYEPSIK